MKDSSFTHTYMDSNTVIITIITYKQIQNSSLIHTHTHTVTTTTTLSLVTTHLALHKVTTYTNTLSHSHHTCSHTHCMHHNLIAKGNICVYVCVYVCVCVSRDLLTMQGVKLHAEMTGICRYVHCKQGCHFV